MVNARKTKKAPFRFRKGAFRALKRILGSDGFVNRNATLADRTFKFHLTVAEGVESEISTDTHAGTGIKLGAALANDDAAWLDDFAAIALHASILRLAISPVSSRTLTFFMCQLICLPLLL